MPSYIDMILTSMRAYPTLLDACGVVGSILYVGGFALVQYGRTCGNGPLYSASKIVAAILVLISLVGAFNLGAFLIQIGFVTFGVMGLMRRQSNPKAVQLAAATPPTAYVQNEPAFQDDLPRTCDWQSRPPGPVHDTPIPLYPARVGPTP